VQIDTRLGGWPAVTAAYLLDGPAPVLVETGSQSSVPTLLGALGHLGVGSHDLAAVVVTHIHLDHAGGVGDVARAFPRAAVYVHEKGARHLADPSRLVASAARVYGDRLDSLYGRLTPTDEARIRVLGDGDEIAVGPDRVLTAVDTPGHARHHLSLHDSGSGILFTGDAAGVRLPDVGVLWPATPPPDFDLELAVGSLRRMAAHRPSALAFAHFGLVAGDPGAVLAEAEDVVRSWAGVAGRAWRAGDDVAAALTAAFDHQLAGADEVQRCRMDALNGIGSNATGLHRWLESGGSPPP
jgi:glyoxylase-like metal-dependent hydrolase (beta-lactamase superfamily II)